MTKADVLALLAVTPVLLVLVLMTVAGWSAARAGAVTAAVTSYWPFQRSVSADLRTSSP